MKTIEILVGIPCSGKSTYSSKQEYNSRGTLSICKSISRDNIRLKYFGRNYKQNKRDEINVSSFFNMTLESYLQGRHYSHIIIDNTHCKEKYIDDIIKEYSNLYNIKIKFFDIPLLKALYRNIVRYYETKKWIPIKIIYQMYKNYNKINKQKYEKFFFYK